MRVIASISILTTLGLAACGTMGEPREGSYIAQQRQLAEDCRAKGGILAPTGSQSARPQTDNVCRVTSVPSDRVRPN